MTTFCMDGTARVQPVDESAVPGRLAAVPATIAGRTERRTRTRIGVASGRRLYLDRYVRNHVRWKDLPEEKRRLPVEGGQPDPETFVVRPELYVDVLDLATMKVEARVRLNPEIGLPLGRFVGVRDDRIVLHRSAVGGLPGELIFLPWQEGAEPTDPSDDPPGER